MLGLRCLWLVRFRYFVVVLDMCWVVLVSGRFSVCMRLCKVWFIVSVLLVSVLLGRCMLFRYFFMVCLFRWYLLLGMLVVVVELVM